MILEWSLILQNIINLEIKYNRSPLQCIHFNNYFISHKFAESWSVYFWIDS